MQNPRLRIARHTSLSLIFALCTSAALAAPASYAIDPDHTAARFGYNHMNWTKQLHRFDKVAGTLTLDQEAKTGSVDISIDVKTIHTGSAALDGELLYSSDYFDVGKFPTITFKSTDVKFEGNKVVSVEGMLTIKGIAKPVTLYVETFQAGKHPRQIKRDAIGANAVATIKRSDFGIDAFPAVSDEVSLSFAVQAFQVRE